MPFDPRKIHAWMSGRDHSLRATALRALTWPAQLPYWLAIRWRNRRYNRHSKMSTVVEVPVISVGNITTGGTGKTPFVEWLAKWFRARDVRVSIVSRGYGAQDGSRNDEARELEKKLPDVPHVQCPDRVAGARIAIDELETQLILLDDGFQHRRIGRNLDIVLLDALEPFGFGHLLPRGLLREPLASLGRAGVIALTRADLVNPGRRQEIRDTVSRFAPFADWLELSHQPTGCVDASGRRSSLESLSGKRIAAIAAIGHPEAFEQTLQKLGLDVVNFQAFADHFHFGRQDIDDIAAKAKAAGADLILCTQKDLVKIEATTIGGLPLTALAIEMAITAGGEAFERRLELLAANALA